MKKVMLVLSIMAFAAVVWKPAAPVAVTEKFEPGLALDRGAQAATLAAKPAASATDAAGLKGAEVEMRIDEIDALIAKKSLVEKSNRGALSASELAELRRLLGLRNEYFSRKLDLELGGQS